MISSLIGISITKNKLWIYPLIFSVIFFLIYRDLYYLYLHLLLPFIVLLAVEFISFLNTKKEELVWVFILLYVSVTFYSIYGYVNTYAPEGIFNQPAEIASVLGKAPENFPIYGAQEVAPLLALMSGKKIFDNVIDTNTQNFLTGAQNLEEVSMNAVQDGVYLVARVANYPDQNIHDTGFEGYFDKKNFDQSCSLYQAFNRTTPDDPLNEIAIYKCLKTNN